MPFQSEAQRRKFLEMVKSGEISQDTYDEWHQATGNKKLPERVGQPVPTETKRKRRAAGFHRARVIK